MVESADMAPWVSYVLYFGRNHWVTTLCVGVRRSGNAEVSFCGGGINFYREMNRLRNRNGSGCVRCGKAGPQGLRTGTVPANRVTVTPGKAFSQSE